jgi:hypothetical protein
MSTPCPGSAAIYAALERASLLHATGRQREALRELRLALDALHAGAGVDEHLFDRALGLRVRVLRAMDPDRANVDAANDT